MNRDETERMISSSGIIPKKSKGQNFLIDGRVADRHVAFAEIGKSDRILEVGPGFGILTERLLALSDDVTAIELDAKLADHVEHNFLGLKLMRGDAMKVDFPEFDKFVSNLPYSISTPIIFKLLEHNFKKAVVMVQKEFADRMVADVGSVDYSRLTVNLFYRADCRILETVPASRFNPRPKVDSAIVEIIPRTPPFTVLDESTFFKVTEVTFNHRRKKISSSLRSAGLPYDVPFADSRIEDLRPEEIGKIADAVFSQRTDKPFNAMP